LVWKAVCRSISERVSPSWAVLNRKGHFRLGGWLIGLAGILPIARAASFLIHLMLAEVQSCTGRGLQIVKLMQLCVLRGRIGRWLLWMVFAFLANLAACVSGAGEIVADLTATDRQLTTFLV
jgi:hypothetical protein